MKIAICLLVCILSSQAFAWGPTGHRTIGHIAEHFMTDKALKASREILSGMSLARASTWADEIRSDPATYSHTYDWHYTDWPDQQDHHDHSTETEDGGKLLSALGQQIKTLASSESSAQDKAFALKFISHLLGDLHQPLHVGNGLDAGGNFCRITYFGEKMNLHALWDDGMINSTRLSFTELATFLLDGLTPIRLQMLRSGNINVWAQESKDLRQQIYPQDPITPQSSLGVPSYCLRSPNPSDIPKLGYEYNYQFMSVVEERLLAAGIRLAAILNEAL
jgi:hypothetical protein